MHPTDANAPPIRTFYVNLFGGAGCGKSTLMAGIFYHLKLLHVRTEMCTEYAKDLVWQKATERLEDQYHVAFEQNQKLHAMNGIVDVVVSDGPLANSLYYTEHYPHVSDTPKTQARVYEWLQDYRHLNIFLQRGSFPYEQAGRYQSAQEAMRMDSDVYARLHKDFDLIVVDSSSPLAPSTIAYAIFEFLHARPTESESTGDFTALLWDHLKSPEFARLTPKRV